MKNQNGECLPWEATENGPAEGTPFWKRALDILCIVLVLPGLLLIMGGVAIFIKLVSPGPVFFVQDRMGYLGRRFRCLKFRTMKPNASSEAHREHLMHLVNADVPMTKMDLKGDPRLIPMGAFLRSTGLDELPQLINVLKGDMSLVGPRPCTPYEYEYYLPWQKERFKTLPGLTGLWQVSGKNKTTFSQMINLDIAYIRSQSFLLDIKIMAKTFGVLAEQVREARNGHGHKEARDRQPSTQSPLQDMVPQADPQGASVAVANRDDWQPSTIWRRTTEHSVDVYHRKPH